MRSYRSLKIADAIRNEMLTFFQDGTFDDPRVEGVTVTHVELSKDNSNAKIYFTVPHQQDVSSKEVETVLNHAAGYVRTLLAQSLNLGYTPSVRFHFDHAAIAGERLSDILEKIAHEHKSAD